MDPFLGEIKLVPYTFAPQGWAFCNGQIMAIAQNQALFQLLGTKYGGNGTTTFGLPDLRGRAAISEGQGQGLSNYKLGEQNGVETVTLTNATMPTHTHQLNVSNAAGTSASAPGQYLALSGANIGNAYGSAPATTMAAPTVSMVGGNQPHNNLQPYLTCNYVIALQGTFPPKP